MERNKMKAKPKFNSLEELVSFFVTNDLGEYWDQMPEAHFDIEIKKRTHIFSLDEDLVEGLNAIARAKQIPSRMLINEWLREKVVEQAKVPSYTAQKSKLRSTRINKIFS